jgi:hypothetical protein
VERRQTLILKQALQFSTRFRNELSRIASAIDPPRRAAAAADRRFDQSSITDLQSSMNLWRPHRESMTCTKSRWRAGPDEGPQWRSSPLWHSPGGQD